MILFPLTLSYNTLLATAIVLFIAWILAGYPQWRAARIHSQEKHAEQSQKQQQQQQQQQQDTTLQAADQEEPSAAKQQQDLSLIHYILAMPLATVYIAARALLDCLRNALYYALWFFEQSAPAIDAWLFDKVTVWLPAKYDQCELWWTTRGVHGWHKAQNYAVSRAIPAAIYGCDQFFAGLGHGYRSLYKASVRFGNAWQRFSQKHDWKQLATDMVDVWTAVVWQPAAWIVSRSWRLATIAYYGGQNVVKSVKADVYWVVMEALPTLGHALAQTRAYNWTLRFLVWTDTKTRYMIARLLESAVLPLLQSLHQGTIVSIDFVAAVVNSPLFQSKFQAVYTAVVSSAVWVLRDQIAALTDSVDFVLLSVVPCITWFINDVAPRLSAAYNRLTVTWWKFYERHLRPTLVAAYCLAQPIALAVYTRVSAVASVPFVALWELAQAMASAAWDFVQLHGNHTLSASIHFMQQSASYAWPVAKQLYAHVSLYIAQQAPALGAAFSNAWELAVSRLAQTDIADMKEWASHIAERTFESLERILSEWIKEQSQTAASQC